jgi:ABC-type proline/glycine betaine transport system substrate-binding protein
MLIAGDHMNPLKAGQQWVQQHADVVNGWLQ